VEVVNILSELCREKGLTVILALHDIDLAMKGCELVMMLKNGKVEAQGRPETISGKGAVQELYGIKNASYDELLGCIELSLPRKSVVFVVGGGGSGIPLYRALNRAGIGMCCGVLHENDCEAHVAEAICGQYGRIVMEKPFMPIGERAYKEALELMRTMETVIDTGFEVGDINKANTELIKDALKQGKTVCTCRSREEAEKIYGSQAEKMKYYCGIDSLTQESAIWLKAEAGSLN
jgi:iron complex transport system ATP-binding protein